MNTIQRYAANWYAAFDMRHCDTCSKLFNRDNDDCHIDDSGDYCKACYDAYWQEEMRSYAWMIPLVRDAEEARREGDYETCKALTEACGVRYEGPDA